MKICICLLSVLLLFGCSNNSSNSASTDSCGFEESSTTYLKVCTFVATPTSSESITLKNYDSQAYTLTGWKLCDKNAFENGYTGCQSLSSTVIQPKSTSTLSGFPFQINDSGEIIYLLNDQNATIHTKSN